MKTKATKLRAKRGEFVIGHRPERLPRVQVSLFDSTENGNGRRYLRSLTVYGDPQEIVRVVESTLIDHFGEK